MQGVAKRREKRRGGVGGAREGEKEEVRSGREEGRKGGREGREGWQDAGQSDQKSSEIECLFRRSGSVD